MGNHRRTWSLAATALAALILAACNGYATEPQNVTSTSADLHAMVSCSGSSPGNPCIMWFQYWPDGGSILTTPKVTFGHSTNGLLDVHQTVTGLNPGTLYHYQLCGYGDNVNAPGLCMSPEYTGSVDAVTRPGTEPSSGDMSASDNFRTGTSTNAPTIDLDRVLTTADTASNPISQDDGVSASYATGKDIWVFADTSQVNGPSTSLGTAAEGSFQTGSAPNSLQQIPPGSSPSAFFAEPTGLDAPNQNPPQPCGLPAAWVNGATRTPGSSSVLLSYVQVCDGNDFLTERLSLVTYTPDTSNTSPFGTTYTPFSASPLYSGLPPIENLASPVYGSDGYLYLFANNKDLTNPATYFDSGLYVARVPSSPASDMGNPSDYQWWSQPPGQDVGWNGIADAGYSVSVIPNEANFGVSVADYSSFTSKHLAVIEQTGLGTSSTMQVYEATSPIGPWSAGPAGQVPDSCVGTTFPCRALIGHPELSTSNTLLFSWYSGDDENGSGHDRVGSIAW